MKSVLGDLSGITPIFGRLICHLNHATETKDGWPPRSERRVKLWVRQSVYHSWNKRKNQLGYGSRTHSEFAEILLHRVTISPQKQILGDLKTYLAIEMSKNNTLTHGKLWRCQTKRSDTQITAEIMQTYEICRNAI